MVGKRSGKAAGGPRGRTPVTIFVGRSGRTSDASGLWFLRSSSPTDRRVKSTAMRSPSLITFSVARGGGSGFIGVAGRVWRDLIGVWIGALFLRGLPMAVHSRLASWEALRASDHRSSRSRRRRTLDWDGVHDGAEESIESPLCERERVEDDGEETRDICFVGGWTVVGALDGALCVGGNGGSNVL